MWLQIIKIPLKLSPILFCNMGLSVWENCSHCWETSAEITWYTHFLRTVFFTFPYTLLDYLNNNHLYIYFKWIKKKKVNYYYCSRFLLKRRSLSVAGPLTLRSCWCCQGWEMLMICANWKSPSCNTSQVTQYSFFLTIQYLKKKKLCKALVIKLGQGNINDLCLFCNIWFFFF